VDTAREPVPPLSAADAFEWLGRGPLAGFRLGLIHGRMGRGEQEKTMERFRSARLDVLVGTVVVEVGVDVPAATCMVVLHADRFGLAQLHQLRGRVGRGGEEGYFWCVDGGGNPGAQARLDALARTSDGFAIAETDLRLRGPGEFFGTRQHGLAGLKLLDLAQDIDIIREARAEAGQLLEKDSLLSDPSHGPLRRALVARYGEDWPGAAM